MNVDHCGNPYIRESWNNFYIHLNLCLFLLYFESALTSNRAKKVMYCLVTTRLQLGVKFVLVHQRTEWPLTQLDTPIFINFNWIVAKMSPNNSKDTAESTEEQRRFTKEPIKIAAKPMLIVVKQSLKEALAQAIAHAFCQDLEMRYFLVQYSLVWKYCQKDDRPQAVLNYIIGNVKKRVFNIKLPRTLQYDILYFIKHVACETALWMDKHSSILNCNFMYCLPGVLSRFCWTSDFTIDENRTALALVRSEVLDVESQFLLACYYGLGVDAWVICIHLCLVQSYSEFVDVNIMKHLYAMFPKKHKENLNVKIVLKPNKNDG